MPDAEPPESPRAASVFRRPWDAVRTAGRRRRVFGGIAVVLVAGLVAVGTVLLTSGGSHPDDGPPPLATPHTRPDPVPAWQPLTDSDIPDDCGVSADTRKKLVPGIGRGDCRWSAVIDDQDDCASCPSSSSGYKWVLDVTVDVQDGAMGNWNSPFSEAMVSFIGQRKQAASNGDPYRTVRGLGDQAMIRYTHGHVTETEGGAVVFRYHNAVVTVTYTGGVIRTADPANTQVSKKAALNGALRAASDVAGALDADAPAKPEITSSPAAGPRALTSLPPPCDMVPRATRNRMVPHAIKDRAVLAPSGQVSLLFSRSTEQHCARRTAYGESPSRSGPERHLTVTVASFPDQGQPGRGTRNATRVYLLWHHNARHLAGQHRSSTFHALTGPGDQAFSRYGASSAPNTKVARVSFRVRNVLVTVRYAGQNHAGSGDSGSGGRPISKKQAIDSAYTVATKTAAALPT